MSEATLAELTGVVARLALNYSKAFEDADLQAVVADWAEQLSGFDFADIELARKGMMADPHVRYFPPISDFRKRVQLARADRRREDGEGDGCPACVGSGGSIGWQDAGTGPTGNEYVRGCPNGCKPPRFGHTFRRLKGTDLQPELMADPERAKAHVQRLAAALKAPNRAAALAALARPQQVHPHDSEF